MPFAICHAQSAPPVIDRTAFAFTHYGLSVTLTPADHKLDATGKLTLRNESKLPQKNISLQISSTLGWNSIEVQGRPAQYLVQPYTSDIDHTGELTEAIVTLPQPLAPRGSIELNIHYSGEITQDSTRLERIGVPPEVRNRQDWDQIAPDFTALRGAGYVVWYPVAMNAASMSNGAEYPETLGEWYAREQQSSMDLNLCQSPVGTMRFVVSGVETGLAPSPEMRQAPSLQPCSKFHWPRLNLNSPTAALAPFKSLDVAQNLRIHYLAPSEQSARNYGELAKAVAPLVTDEFGAPRQAAALVQLPDQTWSPYESGATLFTPLQPSLSDEAKQFVELALAHELTHASFPSPRAWLYEGAAHFAQALERERQAGRAAALQYLSEQLPPLVAAEKANSADDHRGPSLINSADDVYFRTKAMFVFWMLRDIAGDAALRGALLHYRPEADRDPGYFQLLVEAEAHKQLDWFFNTWVYGDSGLPDLSISAVSPRQTLAGAYMVAVTVENNGGAEVEAPVTVRSDLSEATGRVRVPAHGHATVRIQIGQYPTAARVNDGSIPETNIENNEFAVPPKRR